MTRIPDLEDRVLAFLATGAEPRGTVVSVSLAGSVTVRFDDGRSRKFDPGEVFAMLVPASVGGALRAEALR